MDGPAWPLVPVLLLLAASWLTLGWPWLSGRVTIPWDAKAHFLPQIQFLAQSLADGQSPFWTPYVFSGHPQVADPQSMIFSPPFLILALLNGNPGLRAADTTLLCMILFGAACLVLWFRDQGWHWAGAAIAGLSFAFGAAMAWRIQHIGQVLSCVYLALTLVLLSRALARRSPAYGFLAGVAGGLMVLGRDQVALLGAYLLIGYAIVTLCSDTNKEVDVTDAGDASRSNLPMRLRGSAWPLLAGVVGGALVVTIPLLLTAMVAAESNRPAIDLEGAGRGSLHPALLLTLFSPDIFGSAGRMEDFWGPPSFTWRDTGLYTAQNVGILYIGAAPALLISLGALSGRLWTPEIRFFTIAAVMMLVYALGWYTPFFTLFHFLLPGVNLFRRPADAVFLVGFLGAILAGYVAHRLLCEPLVEIKIAHAAITGGIVLTACLIALGLGVRFDRLSRTLLPLGTAGAAFVAAAAMIAWALWLKPIRPVVPGLLLVGLTALDLAWHNGPTTSSAMPPAYYDVLNPDTGNETIALLKRKVAESTSPVRRDRVELAGLGFHWPNASMTHRLENTLGYNPLRLGLYSRATGAEDHVGLPDQRKFSPLFPSYRSPLADLLGLRYIATGSPIESVDKRIQPGELQLLARTPDGYVYENRRALPRVVFATEARLADFDAMLISGDWPDVDYTTTVLLQQTFATPAVPLRPGSVRMAHYRNTEVVVETKSPDGGFVVLNDVWHPWWHAEVDGEPVRLLRANVLFRAVPVGPGEHSVRFVFRPLARAGAHDLATGR